MMTALVWVARLYWRVKLTADVYWSRASAKAHQAESERIRERHYTRGSYGEWVPK
jgi:hypothetical protein